VKPIRILAAVAALLALASTAAAAPKNRRPRPHNVIIFVADGLRSGSVTEANAPELMEVRRKGVDFANSHSLYPTFTTVNASAIATGHGIGDTGNFGNEIWAGPEPLPAPAGTSMAELEDDAVLGLMNDRFGGTYLGETSLIAVARRAGYSTAVLGKEGPAAIQDVTARDGQTIVIDDETGHPGSVLPLPDDVARAMQEAGLAAAAPSRPKGSPYVDRPNTEQQAWLGDIAAKVLLPRFKARGRPFVLLFWSRDPDISQHNQCDAPCALVPGINGPTSMAAIANASASLGRLRRALKQLGLEATTDVFVTADHGFSTISKQSRQGVLNGRFLARDLARAFALPAFDRQLKPVDPSGPIGGVFIGRDPHRPEIVVASNGGTDLIYLPRRDRTLARRIVADLTRRDYTGAIFVDDAYGAVPGALPLSAVGLKGVARTPTPAIVVSFRSFTTGCARPEICAVEIADTGRSEGQGMHGTLSRADTHNFMAAIGPDFKAGFVDPAPVSNADIAPTLARALRIELPSRGKLKGRVVAEALKGGAATASRRSTIRSRPAANGFVTVLNRQTVGAQAYYDAGGMPGRVVGLRR
jgi:arylsulfatase A-like enzyme